MVTKFHKPQTTLLSQSNKPLSDEERAQLGKEWAERTLDSLLAYTKTEPSFGKKFCKKVESDDGLAKQMLKHLRDARKGKTKGPKKWDRVRYFQMLMHYEISKEKNGREKALEAVGKAHGIGIQSKEQIFNPKKVEEKIRIARKIISKTELALYLPSFVNPPQKNKAGGWNFFSNH